MAVSMLKTHWPVPLHAPSQPVKLVTASRGVAGSVTTPPILTAQVSPQSIPAGSLVTVPVELPVLYTLSGYVTYVNVAVTLLAASIVTTHSPVPLHPEPSQPVNAE